MNGLHTAFLFRAPDPAVRLRRDPFFAVFEHFFFPDRHRAFEFSDGPFAGFEGGFAVWGAGGDHDAGFADLQAAGAMHDAEVSDLKMLVSFSAEALHLSQRHRVVAS